MTGDTPGPSVATDVSDPPAQEAEPRWPMALAIIIVAILRLTLPPQLKLPGSDVLIPVFTIALLGAIIIADPGRIDRQTTWVRILTDALIGFVSIVNAWSAVKLVAYILGSGEFNNAAILLRSGAVIWFTNVISFGLWYWDLDRGGAAARARSSGASPAFVFPEMGNPEIVQAGWYPRFVDYLHLSFNTAMAFSPTDVSAIKPWAKLLMMLEESISLILAVLVIARAVNIMK